MKRGSNLQVVSTQGESGNVTVSSLDSRYIIKALNSGVVSVIRYGTGFVARAKWDLQKLERKARKLLAIYEVHYSEADINGFYLKKGRSDRCITVVEE